MLGTNDLKAYSKMIQANVALDLKALNLKNSSMTRSHTGVITKKKDTDRSV